MREDFTKGRIGENYFLHKKIFSFTEDIHYIIGLQLKRHFEDNEKFEKINILEIGPGLGNTTLEILAADERICITAVDNSKLMIEQLKENINNLNRVNIVYDEILHFLKNNKNIYHGIVSTLTLHTFNKEDREEVLKYSLENLDKNGIFVNGDKYSQDNFLIRNYHALIELATIAKGIIPKGKFKLFMDWVKHYEVDSRKDIIMKEKESITLMDSLGFENINRIYRNSLYAIISAYKI